MPEAGSPGVSVCYCMCLLHELGHTQTLQSDRSCRAYEVTVESSQAYVNATLCFTGPDRHIRPTLDCAGLSASTRAGLAPPGLTRPAESSAAFAGSVQQAFAQVLVCDAVGRTTFLHILESLCEGATDGSSGCRCAGPAGHYRIWPQRGHDQTCASNILNIIAAGCSTYQGSLCCPCIHVYLCAEPLCMSQVSFPRGPHSSNLRSIWQLHCHVLNLAASRLCLMFPTQRHMAMHEGDVRRL